MFWWWSLLYKGYSKSFYVSFLYYFEDGGFGGYFLFIMTLGVHIDVSLVSSVIRDQYTEVWRVDAVDAGVLQVNTDKILHNLLIGCEGPCFRPCSMKHLPWERKCVLRRTTLCGWHGLPTCLSDPDPFGRCGPSLRVCLLTSWWHFLAPLIVVFTRFPLLSPLNVSWVVQELSL